MAVYCEFVTVSNSGVSVPLPLGGNISLLYPTPLPNDSLSQLSFIRSALCLGPELSVELLRSP